MDYSRITKKTFNLRSKFLFSDGNMFDASEYIRLTKIDIDFQNYKMPLISLVYKLPVSVMVSLQEDSEKFVVSLGASSIDADTANSYINDIFLGDIILKPLIIDKRAINISDRLTQDTTDTNYQYEEFECLCVPEICLSINKYNTSGIYSNTNVTEVITRLLTLLPVRTYLSSPDNQKIYDQLALIPGNILTNISHINNAYGIYNDSLKVFMSYNKLVITPMSSMEIVESGNIRIDVKIPVNANPEDQNIMGTYSETNQLNGITDKYINTKINSVVIMDQTELYAELYGTNNIIFNRDMIGLEKDSYQIDSIKDRNGTINKTIVYENKYDNKNLQEYTKQITENNTILRFSFNNMDINIDDCFKKFTITFDSEYYNKYNGDYQVLKMTEIFSTKSNNTTDNGGQIILRKIS
ncbi:hypothetical protein FPHOBKDP_00226 [Listeria phage LPJP1]|nr:hypothetical protein FPHOBKDP_00226 [Listeria phage LPJP1]